MKSSLLMLIAVVMFLSLSEQAEARRGHRKRVRNGVKSGQLTRGEVKDIRSQRRANKEEMSNMRDAARADDGKIDKAERRKIRKERRRNRKEMSQKIRDEKSDEDKRPRRQRREAAQSDDA